MKQVQTSSCQQQYNKHIFKAKQEPKNNNNESWVQQMMANKNYQEFVPSSRPISRTASESAPSEIDGEYSKDELKVDC